MDTLERNDRNKTKKRVVNKTSIKQANGGKISVCLSVYVGLILEPKRLFQGFMYKTCGTAPVRQSDVDSGCMHRHWLMTRTRLRRMLGTNEGHLRVTVTQLVFFGWQTAHDRKALAVPPIPAPLSV